MRWILITFAAIILLAVAFTFFIFNKNIVLEQPLSLPVLNSITPRVVFTNQSTLIILRGSNFDAVAEIKANGISLNSFLYQINHINSNEISMVLPQGTPTGSYSITVTNQNLEESNPLILTVKDPSDIRVTLSNSAVSFVFRIEGNNFFLENLRNLQTNVDFPTTKTDIVSFVLRGVNGVKTNYKISDLPYSFSYILNSGTNKSLILKLENITIDQRNKLDLIATVNLADGSKTGEFFIEAITSTPDYSIQTLSFPLVDFQGLSQNYQEALVAPQYLGSLMLYPRLFPAGSVSAIVNSHTQVSQFLAYYNLDTNDLIYFAVKDPLGYYKFESFSIAPNSLGFGVTHFPENHLTPDIDYISPYPVVLGSLKGDWYDAAQYYRPWATQAFAPRGKLENSPEVSPFLHEMDLQATYGVANDSLKENLSEIVKETQDWKNFFNTCPDPDMPNYVCDSNYLLDHFLVEIYDWQSNDFDEGWPADYKPIHPSVFEAVKQLHQMGDLVIPYTLTLDFDTASPQYGPIVESNSLINESGGLFLTRFVSQNGIWTVPDPSTAWWRDFTRDIMLDFLNFGDDNSTYEGVGFDGIYWDIFSGQHPYLDYSSARGHQGGGNYWLQGEKDRIRESRDALKSVKPEMVFESEISTEFFINELEFVQWNAPPNLPHPIYNVPLYPVIFHDYVGISTIIASNPDLYRSFGILPTYFNYIWATYFNNGVYAGISNGVIGQDYTFPLEDVDKPFFLFIKKLFRSYSYAKKYFVYGQMLRPLELQVADTDISNIGYGSPNVFYKSHYPRIPYVLSSVWNASDGSTGIALINWWNQSVSLNFTFNMSDYGLPSNTPYNLAELNEITFRTLGNYTGIISKSVTMAPESLLVLTVDGEEDLDNVINSYDKCPGTLPSYRSIVSMKNGCPLPFAKNFSQNLTTNFSNINDLRRASNLSLGIVGKGKIEFIGNQIELLHRDILANRYDPLNLDDFISIDYNKISINSSSLPELDKPAKLTMYGINLTNPLIYRDGTPCPASSCQILSYNNNTLVFQVDGFSTYESRENLDRNSGGASGSAGSSGGGSGGSGGSGVSSGGSIGGSFVTQCSDILDNDDDGKTDYPSDPGCSSLADDSEVDSLIVDGSSTGDVGREEKGVKREASFVFWIISIMLILGIIIISVIIITIIRRSKRKKTYSLMQSSLSSTR